MTDAALHFPAGSLVRARGREWVVLPESSPDLLVLRPLGGTDDEVAGVLTAIETVEPATFAPPDPERPGDHLSARLLRDALRLGFRSSAGPFRSFGHLGFEPRPYQLVPLLMALRLDPVRLLIADDVGIGKTIEAALIARELLDQGSVERLAVLTPPHLAEQWQRELAEKFHLHAELVLPSTAGRLEREAGAGQSLFDLHRLVIVSTDFIKSDLRRTEFVRSCPELVIVDEAHTCAADGGGRGRHQRHALIRALAEDPRRRHIILVTATPHSGKPEAFRSLCALLDPAFAELPDELTGPDNETHRRRLARHLVQRKRGDIAHYLDETLFPLREEKEEAYTLSADYRRFFERVIDYARETVLDEKDGRHRQRVRWWSALALLRSLSSSPAAAAATLRTRAAVVDTASEEEADAVGRRLVLDLGDAEEAENIDLTPGSNLTVGAGQGQTAGDAGGDADGESEAAREHRRLLDMARQAEALAGDGDAKLKRLVELLAELLDAGFRPIVFCRFIATAEYLAGELRRRLKKGTEVAAVTSTVPAPEREAQVEALGTKERRVLVATDCLSEGINLQALFDAVVHYDLSWNPTRHEQREGRVDRFGQPAPRVRLLTYYGKDNPVDGAVLDVLIRKSREIRRSLGVTVPFPAANEAAEAIVESLLLRRRSATQVAFEFVRPGQQELFTEWEHAAERERRSRTVFAQESLKVDEVRRELAEVRAAIGAGTDVAAFVATAVRAFGGHAEPVGPTERPALSLDLSPTPEALRQAVGLSKLVARFAQPVEEGQLHLVRTHPVVEGLARHVLECALDPAVSGTMLDGPARRTGVLRTAAVTRRTTLLLVRYRLHLVTHKEGHEQALLAEDAGLLAFACAPDAAEWLDDEAAQALLGAEPAGNIALEQKVDFLKKALTGWPHLLPRVEAAARARAAALLETHRRVREGGRQGPKKSRPEIAVRPELPPDLLGLYVFLPPIKSDGGGGVHDKQGGQ